MKNLMPSKGTILLIVLSMLCFSLASCTVAAQEAAVAGAASVGAIIAAVKPLMSPEAAAKLELIAHSVDGTVQATSAAVSTLVDVITQIKANATSQITDLHTTLQEQAVALAQLPSRTEAHLVAGGEVLAGGAGLNHYRNLTRRLGR